MKTYEKILYMVFAAVAIVGLAELAEAVVNRFDEVQIRQSATSTGNLYTNGNFVDTNASDGCAEWSSNILTSTGVNCGTGSGGGSDFTYTTNGATVHAATTTPTVFYNGLIGHSSSTLRTLKLNDGNASEPALTFSSETNLGIYRGASADLRFSSGGVYKLGLDGAGLYPQTQVRCQYASDGAGEPCYSFHADENTGLNTPSADTLGLSTAGTNRLTIDSAGAIAFNAYDCSGNDNGGVLTADASGNITCDDDDSSVGGGTFAWTPTLNFGQAVNATGTALWMQNGLFASSTSIFASTTIARLNGTYVVDGKTYPKNGAGIQKAIDDCAADPTCSKVLLSEAGTYQTSETIDIVNSGITLECASNDVIIKLADAVNDHIIEIGDGSLSLDVNDVAVKNCQIDGNKSNQTTLKHGIYLHSDITRATISGNYIHDVYGKGVNNEGGGASNRNLYIHIVGNTFQDFQDGVDADCIDNDQAEYVTVEDNICRNPGDDGIDGGAVNYFVIDGNVVDGNNLSDGIEIFASLGVVISNNFVYNAQDFGIKSERSNNASITGNSVWASRDVGIEIVGDTYTTVSGNTIRRCSLDSNNAKSCILLRSGAGIHSTNNIITNNTIWDDTTNRGKYAVEEQDANQSGNYIAFNMINGQRSGDILALGATTTVVRIGTSTAQTNFTGNLGVGTTTPGSILSIQSVGNFSAGTSTLYSGLLAPNIQATGTVIATNYNASSLISCDTIDTDDAGNFKCGSDSTGAGGGAYSFTPTTIGGTEHSASTTRPFYFSQGLLTASTTAGGGVFGSINATSSITLNGIGLVPYTGATTDLDLAGVGLRFSDVNTSIYSEGAGQFTLYGDHDGVAQNALLDLTSITDGRTFTFPDQSGTFCLVGVACDGAGGAAYSFTPITIGSKVYQATSSVPYFNFLSGSTTVGSLTATSSASFLNGLTITCTDCITDTNVADLALGTGTSGNYVLSIADAGNSTITVVNGTAEGGAVTLDVIDVNCTGCLGATEIAGLGTADISGLDVSDDLNLTAGDNLTLTGDDLDLDPTLTGITGITSTGLLDFGGAALEIPNGTGPTIDSVGEIGLDTTDNQIIVSTSTAPVGVIRTKPRLFGTTLASTSVFMNGAVGKLLPVPTETDGMTVFYVRCHVVSGTSVALNLTDGTNDTNSVTCTTTSTEYVITTNNTWTAGELISLERGTVTGAVDYLAISAFGVYTRE